MGTRISIDDIEDTGDVDANGIFTIETDDIANIRMSFAHPGYIASVSSNPVYKLTDSNFFEVDLGSVTPVGNVYDLTAYPVKMTESYLSAYLMESGSSKDIPLANVKVSLTDGLKQTYSALTDSEGNFTIPIGSRYDLELSFALEGYAPIPGINFMTVDADGIVSFDLLGSIP